MALRVLGDLEAAAAEGMDRLEAAVATTWAIETQAPKRRIPVGLDLGVLVEDDPIDRAAHASPSRGLAVELNGALHPHRLYDAAAVAGAAWRRQRGPRA